MVSLFYPSTKTATHALAPYAGPRTSSFYEAIYGLPNATISTLLTHSHLSAPIVTCTAIPAIIFSPGLPSTRISYTAYYEDLASHGYLVVAIDHPYDAQIVEFPDGRVIISTDEEEPDTDAFMDVRVRDVQYVLDRLYSNLTRAIPGASRRLRVAKTGMFGYSFGGAAAANVMLVDARVRGGMNLDGGIYGAAGRADSLKGPFVLMGRPQHNVTGSDETWRTLWGRMGGWKRWVLLGGSTHATFSDEGLFAGVFGLPREAVEEKFGTIEPGRANEVVRAYVRGFFDLVLRGRDGGLYDGPSERYSEVTFEF